MSKSLIIDAGHGGTDPGANGFGVQEKVWTLRISLYQYNRLKALGAKVAITRTTDRTLDSVARTDLIRDKYDYCVSNHWNAFNGQARGVETIHSLKANPRFATNIANRLVKESGLPMRRVFSRANSAGGDFYFMHRLTGSTQTVIIEYSFMDHRADHDWYKNDSNFYKAAEAVVEEVCKEIGVRYVAPNTTPKPTPVPSLSGQLFRVQTGAFSNRASADALQERLEQAGVNTYLVQDQGLFKVQVGAFSKKENAEARAKEIERLGFDTFITTQVGTPAHATKEETVQSIPAAPAPSTPAASISANSRVVLNQSAKNYATGQAIPASRKGVTYTVRQLNSNGTQVLLAEIMSWVHTRDVTPVGSRPQGTANSAGFSKGDRVRASRLYVNSQTTTVANSNGVTGFIDTIQPNWRNEVRLVRTRGGSDYIGFAQRSDLTKL